MVSDPHVDLVIAFCATKKTSLSKTQIREDSKKASVQYKRLIETLTYAGLKAVGRRGEALGHLLVFVACPQELLETLIRRERQSDFLSGLPVAPIASGEHIHSLSPADRIRLVHAYITCTPPDGGLGISPDAPEWDLVESILPLHDRPFNETWVRSWTLRNIASVQLEKIREEFGDSVALYFAFLSSYTRFLIFPGILGLLAHFLYPPYHPLYSALLFIWSISFVEWWRVRERILSLRFGTRGSFCVEKRRAQYKKGQTWWGRELRVLGSLPVILLFAGVLVAILTSIFVFEAFVTKLYRGPGEKFISLAPTLLFVALVPRFMAIYQSLAVRLTSWENHAHQSTHDASLTLKTFALSTFVAYLGLGLSAFVYVPFGEGVMSWVQLWLFSRTKASTGIGARFFKLLNGTTHLAEDSGAVTSDVNVEKSSPSLWDVDSQNARAKLNPARLRDQMFAYTVTNQVVNTFVEVGLPFVLRAISSFRNNGKEKSRNGGGNSPISPLQPTGSSNSGSVAGSGSPWEMKNLKRVVFEDEKEKGGMDERVFLDRVRAEVALPAYELFGDYSEMVVQFGYVALWSTIWPLAGVMALLNNLLELRSDAFKMTVHHRRPIPFRTDTIGPWLDALSFLTWLAALTNSALVYLFSPELFLSSTSMNATASAFLKNVFNETTSGDNSTSTSVLAAEHLTEAAGGFLYHHHQHHSSQQSQWGIDGSSPLTSTATKILLVKAVLVALVASHGFIVVRSLVRHLVERVWWSGSEEVKQREREERKVKERFLGVVGAGIGGDSEDEGKGREGEDMKSRQSKRSEQSQKKHADTTSDEMGFWEHDEGLEEIHRVSKEV